MSDADRRARIVAHLADDADGPALAPERLGHVCAAVTELSGAGIMLMSDDGHRISLCVTDGTSQELERLQFELGEGPCLDAFRLDRPVLEPDLRHPAVPRWVLFPGMAVAAGARAVFGFPMRVGMARVGALNLYRDRPGALSDDQHADALVMAELAASSVLAMQAGAAPGELAGELDDAANFQLGVHQATGMVAVQLNISVSEAMGRLRARAVAESRPLEELARDIVARRARFNADHDAGPPKRIDPGSA